MQDNGGFPGWHLSGRTEWPAIIVREKDEKRSETKQNGTVLCAVLNKIRPGRGQVRLFETAWMTCAYKNSGLDERAG